MTGHFPPLALLNNLRISVGMMMAVRTQRA
jgi:hypothetical protein